jgi:hypothetical protein
VFEEIVTGTAGGATCVNFTQSTPATVLFTATASNASRSTCGPAVRFTVLLTVVKTAKSFVSGIVIEPVTFTPSTSTCIFALGSFWDTRRSSL